LSLTKGTTRQQVSSTTRAAIVKEIDAPLNQTAEFTYDAQTDPRQKTTTFKYDALGRVSDRIG
jgi:hypothetical protein